MKSISLVLFLLSSLSVTAQTYPTGACPFRDFDNNPQHNPQVAEVVTKMAATTWMACDSSKGCISRRVDPSSPVLIYTTDGPWTCGYSADRRGAGPAWFRSSELRLVKYELNPPPLRMERDVDWRRRPGHHHIGEWQRAPSQRQCDVARRRRS
ncbi:MAG TPA: hypothetical protein VK722_09825 [Candidatus Aquilonibacter sp.]|jgi:hypothetical protein|nr:hypothetical protein [Candidatus Aquilonibacter sp.]